MTPQEIVNKINSDDESGVPYEVYHTINKLLDNDKENETLFYLQDYFKCDDDTAKETLILYKKTVYSGHKKIIDDVNASLTPQQIAQANAVAREWQNRPKCPTCSSINVEKISVAKKAVGGAMFGLFSSDVRNTMHCKNCGYKW